MVARLLALAATLLACATAPPAIPAVPLGAIPLRSDVYVQDIAPGVWRHVSYRPFPEAGFIPSNGLIVEGDRGALVVDTAWNPDQTAAILDWIQADVGPVAAFIITHAHDDRLGGIAEVERRGIASYALAKTVEMAATQGWPPIEHAVPSAFPLDSLGVAGELFFPGAAHTADNTTVWLSEKRVLAGGCLVRAATARTMGNTRTGDLSNWPRAVAALQERYPDVRIVVPGHGDIGGSELLAHTRELLGE